MKTKIKQLNLKNSYTAAGKQKFQAIAGIDCFLDFVQEKVC